MGVLLQLFRGKYDYFIVGFTVGVVVSAWVCAAGVGAGAAGSAGVSALAGVTERGMRAAVMSAAVVVLFKVMLPKNHLLLLGFIQHLIRVWAMLTLDENFT